MGYRALWRENFTALADATPEQFEFLVVLALGGTWEMEEAGYWFWSTNTMSDLEGILEDLVGYYRRFFPEGTLKIHIANYCSKPCIDEIRRKLHRGYGERLVGWRCDGRCPGRQAPGTTEQLGSSGDLAGYFAQVDRATLINPDDQPYHVADLGDSLSRSQVTNLLNLGMIEVVDRHEVPPVKEFCRKNYFTRNSVADQLFNS